MKLQLDELNSKIDVMDARAKEAKEDAREKYKAEVAKLRENYKLAVAKLEEVKSAGDDAWEKMASEAEKVRDAIVHSFNYFKSQF